MPRFLITRPSPFIRSAGRPAEHPDEPSEARNSRTAGRRKCAVAFVLLLAWFAMRVQDAPDWLQTFTYTWSAFLIIRGAAELGYARGFIARHRRSVEHPDRTSA